MEKDWLLSREKRVFPQERPSHISPTFRQAQHSESNVGENLFSHEGFEMHGSFLSLITASLARVGRIQRH